jgi:hypothetical protein
MAIHLLGLCTSTFITFVHAIASPLPRSIGIPYLSPPLAQETRAGFNTIDANPHDYLIAQYHIGI